MKKTLLLILILCILCSLSVYSEVFTLQQCIDTALVGSIEARKQQNTVTSSRLQYRQSQAAFSPSINGSVGQAWTFGRSITANNTYRSVNQSNTSFNLSASLVLWDGLANKYELDQAKAALKSSEAQLEMVQLQIKLNIATMYLQALLSKELLKVAENQLADTQAKLHQKNALLAANRVAEGETYALQAQVAKDELSVVQTRNEAMLALLDLAQAMELADYSNFDIQVPAEDELQGNLLPNNEQVYQTALNNRPEMRALQYTIEASESALKAAKSAYSPTLSAGAAVGTGYYHQFGADNNPFSQQMKENFSAQVGLNLSIPIYDKLQTPTRVKKQKVTIENTKLDLEQQKKKLRKEIDQAYYNAKAAQVQENAAREAERATEEALRYAEKKYEAGRATTYEYTEAKNAHLQAQSTRLQAQYNYLFRLHILQYFQGIL